MKRVCLIVASALLLAGCGDEASEGRLVRITASQLDGRCSPAAVADLRVRLLAWLEVQAEGEGGIASRCFFDFATEDPVDLSIVGECRLPPLDDATLRLVYALELNVTESLPLATFTLESVNLRDGRNIIDFQQAETNIDFDADEDMVSNLEEVCGDSDPNDETSVPQDD